MFEHNIKNIIVLLLLISARVHNENNKKSKITKKGTTIYSIADVLQTLLKLNEARYDTFKKLNTLNNVHYMRTLSEQEIGNKFWETFKKLTKLFKLSFKPSHEKEEDASYRYYDVYHDSNYIFTIPVPKGIDLMNINLSLNAASDEKDDNRNLRDYMCGRAKTRCKSACAEALQMTCIISTVCVYDFYIQMLQSCNHECKDRF